MAKNLVVSLVGTSLLTNQATSDDERKKINSLTNFRAAELSGETTFLNTILERIDLSGKSFSELQPLSAELKSLVNIYSDKSALCNDFHFLLHTDTYTGERCAEKLAGILSLNHFTNVQLVRVMQLSTKDKISFLEGIKWLINWCEETLPAYQQAGYEIIFNLTGGFKSLQGYMNIVGMFYADKLVYIFETSDELLEIPKLPVQLDLENIRKVARSFLLADFTVCEKNLVNDLPSVYLDQDHSHCTLSPIGRLIWNRYKRKILSEELIQWPNLVYESSFHNDFKAANRNPVKLQEVLAKVSYLLFSSSGNISVLKKDGGLQYENFKNKQINGQPIGHFRITQETRVSCVAKNGQLYLRHFGPHDYVNNNP